jgi:NitT/TauT family transport system ATP-binding protein
MPQDAATSAPIITVHDLAKTYRSKREGLVEALAPVSFSIPEGEFVCLVGPSGCGKSTLLKILAGIVPRSGGDFEIRHGGRSTADCHIGLVFQSPVLLPWRTVLQNTVLPADVLDLDRVAAEQRARELLAMVGLQGFEQSYPSELSGGMQQRCAITRALLHDPPILLMDEPFGALDAQTRTLIEDDFLKLWRDVGMTVVFVTHDLSEAIAMCTKVVIITARPGRVKSQYKIDLPNGLSTTDRKLAPGFQDLFSQIWGDLRDEVGSSLE